MTDDRNSSLFDRRLVVTLAITQNPQTQPRFLCERVVGLRQIVLLQVLEDELNHTARVDLARKSKRTHATSTEDMESINPENEQCVSNKQIYSLHRFNALSAACDTVVSALVFAFSSTSFHRDPASLFSNLPSSSVFVASSIIRTITFRRSVRPATSHSSPIPTLRLQLRTALSQRLLTHLQQRFPRSHTTLRRQLRTRTLRHRLVPLPVAVLQQPRTQRAKTLQRGVCEDLPLDIVLLLQSL